MGKFGGFGGYGGGFGGGNNMQALMKQAQKMQEDALKTQQEVDETELEGKSAGGLVVVKILGNKKLVSIKISPEAVDDVEMLEDLVLVAFNDAIDKADTLRESKLGKLGGGLI